MSRPTRGPDDDRTPSAGEGDIDVAIPGFPEWERRHAETGADSRESASAIRASGESADRQSRHGRCPDE